MPRKIETLVYTYAELKEGVKAGTIKQSAVDKAKQWLSEGNTLDDWWEYVSEMWQQALAQAGFENAEISFSGFWSQGDGRASRLPSTLTNSSRSYRRRLNRRTESMLTPTAWSNSLTGWPTSLEATR